MIIVCGSLDIKIGKRASFLVSSREAVLAARKVEDCIDFAVSADLIEENRVNVFECWKSKKALIEFRGSGPGEDLSALIMRADIKEYEVK